jgi:hypothetical protein
MSYHKDHVYVHPSLTHSPHTLLITNALQVKQEAQPRQVSLEEMTDYALRHSEKARSVAQAEQYCGRSIRLQVR